MSQKGGVLPVRANRYLWQREALRKCRERRVTRPRTALVRERKPSEVHNPQENHGFCLGEAHFVIGNRDRQDFYRNRKPVYRDPEGFYHNRKPFYRDPEAFYPNRRAFYRDSEGFYCDRRTVYRDPNPLCCDRKAFCFDQRGFDSNSKGFGWDRKGIVRSTVIR